MADVDPETLLEWLSMGQGDERDMQLIALEQLCMLLLMSDNVDRCFEWYASSISNYIIMIFGVDTRCNLMQCFVCPLVVHHARFSQRFAGFFWTN